METEFQQLRNRVEQLERDNRTLMALISFVKIDKFVIPKDVKMNNGRNFVFSGETGTKFGTDVTQKMSFYGVSPVIQQSTITSPTGGATVDSQSRSSINEIKSFLTTIGLTA